MPYGNRIMKRFLINTGVGDLRRFIHDSFSGKRFTARRFPSRGQSADSGWRAYCQGHNELPADDPGLNNRCQPWLLGQLYSGPMARQYAHRTKLVIAPSARYHQRAHNLFHRHGLSALLVGRFIAFVRTLLPTIAGLSGLSNARFQFFNWMSGFRGGDSDRSGLRAG